MKIIDKDGYHVSDIHYSEDANGQLGQMFKYESFPSCSNCSECLSNSKAQHTDGYGVGYFIDSVVIWCKKCGYTIDQFYFDQPEANEKKVISHKTAYDYADDFFTEDMMYQIND
jgi:hypothetical protein